MFPIHDDTERVHGRPYVNYALIAINVIVFIWQAVVTNFFTDPLSTGQIFLTYGAIPQDLVAGNNLATIVTSMFMHGGIAHILGNMVFLFIFGDNIEDRFGRLKYLLIYLGWGAVAAFVHSAYIVSISGDPVPAVGASGAISGVLGAYLVLYPRAKIYTIILAFFITTIRIPALAYIPFWFILQIIFALVGQSGGVAYLAHIGGFVAGVGTAYAWKLFSGPGTLQKQTAQRLPSVRKERPRIEEAAPVAPPEVIEGPDFFEIIAEIRGISDASEIKAVFEPEKKSMRIIAEGQKKYNMLAKLPDTAASPTVKYIEYLNGIARIRVSK